ncbi:MAG: RidA family protein [Sphingopyxis sp.]|nr:RidA family protein [Sphingopyxis sp.]
MPSPYAALAAAALALPFAAPAAARDPAAVLMPENAEARAFQEAVGFADAVIAGDTVYLSGVVAAPRDGEAGLEPAFERAFGRIADVLARAGVSWDDVVEMTTFHTDLPAQIDAFVAVKNRHVKGPPPAWTAIGISRLYEPTAIVEVKVIARKPKAKD